MKLQHRTPQPPLVMTKAVQIFRGILKGVSYLHSKGIIHGDLKVSNVMIENSWEELPDENYAETISPPQDSSTPLLESSWSHHMSVNPLEEAKENKGDNGLFAF